MATQVRAGLTTRHASLLYTLERWQAAPADPDAAGAVILLAPSYGFLSTPPRAAARPTARRSIRLTRVERPKLLDALAPATWAKRTRPGRARTALDLATGPESSFQFALDGGGSAQALPPASAPRPPRAYGESSTPRRHCAPAPAPRRKLSAGESACAALLHKPNPTGDRGRICWSS